MYILVRDSGLISLSVDHLEASFKLRVFITGICSLNPFVKKELNYDFSLFFGEGNGLFSLKFVPFLATN